MFEHTTLLIWNLDDFLPEYTTRQDGLNCKFVITAGLEYKEVVPSPFVFCP